MRTGLGPWGNTVTVAVIVWFLLGLFALTMPVALLIWVVIGVVGAAVLYFSGVRFWKWGIGQ